jgi:FAD:protein FMN transferase
MTPRWWPLRRRQRLTLIREVHYAMGTLLDIQLYHEFPDMGARLLRQACQEVRRLEALFSRHVPTSELSRLNRQAGRGPILIAPELFDLLRTARQWAQWSQGTFDPTIGTLSRLWQAAGTRGQGPAPDRLQAAQRAVGWPRLRLLPPHLAELTTAGMELDLGAIAKGYAVDRIGDLLRQHGIHHALINFGESSLLALGSMPDGRAWPMAVRRLDGGVSGNTFTIRDSAVSTSSSLGQACVLEGRTLGHVVDPHHGQPHERPLAVTVMAPTATAAEALSTALVVWTAAGEAIPPLPSGVSAYRVSAGGAFVPIERASAHATLCGLGL